MITLEKKNLSFRGIDQHHDTLCILAFRFPDVHQNALCNIRFERTLRIPDNGDTYPLPPSLGSFPLRHVDDFKHRLPTEQLQRGGVIMPMHQAEAMWINFSCRGGYPFAVKIGTGKINAATGEPWSNDLNSDPQDYLTIPKQPWLDGCHVEKDSIRQFVAMPLGEGYSVEEQITGEAEHGGLQISVMPMKADHYERLVAIRLERERENHKRGLLNRAARYSMSPNMGLSAGGMMRQEIYEDPYGLDAWDQSSASRCFVTIVNSKQWIAITGEIPPTIPPSAADYSRRGFPWFDYYDADAKVIAAGNKFRKIKSVAEMGRQLGSNPLPENETVSWLKRVLIFNAKKKSRSKPQEGLEVREDSSFQKDV